MLNKLGNLGGLLAQRDGHPLANPREFKRILGELPVDNAFKSLDEIAGWLESLASADDIPAEKVYDIARQFEEAAQPHLKRLTREYLQVARLPKGDERRLWSINYGFWNLIASTYERCLDAAEGKDKAAEPVRALLPAIAARLIAAGAETMKWDQFHYVKPPAGRWRLLGRALRIAESAGVDRKSVQLGSLLGVSSPHQEFVRAVAFHAASLDSLLPSEIEMAKWLIAHFLHGLVFTALVEPDSVYWIDLETDQPPLRLALRPSGVRPSQRFFKPAQAHTGMLALLQDLERGGDIPADLVLGERVYPKMLIPVLRHLVAYLAPIPPQRKHDRHRVKHRMSVLNGLVNAYVAFSGEFGGKPPGLAIESWVVDNVSRGGFGIVLNSIQSDWLKVGALVAMQPEGGDNWLLGIIRRYHKDADGEARVGINAIGRKVSSVELRVTTASSYAAVAGFPALMILDDNEPGEVRVVLPFATFDLRERLEFQQDGQRQLLTPVSLVEQTADFELARYRQSVA